MHIGRTIMMSTLALCSCGHFSSDRLYHDGTPGVPAYIEEIRQDIDKGMLASAEKKIKESWTVKSPHGKDSTELVILGKRINTIREEFTLTETQAAERFRSICDTTEEAIHEWLSSPATDMLTLENTKMYHRYAVEDFTAVNGFPGKNGRRTDEDYRTYRDTVKSFIRKNAPHFGSGMYKTFFIHPVCNTMEVKLTIEADAVPDGETVRAWLPFPASGYGQQRDFILEYYSENSCTISPERFQNSTLYMEKAAEKGTPTEFSYKVKFISLDKVSSFSDRIFEKGGYVFRKDDPEYVRYTSEEFPYIVFTDRLKRLTDSITGDVNQHPYIKAYRIFSWIDSNISIAMNGVSSSIIGNIPDYVIEKRHGSAEQINILYVTMLRYCGIPSRTASGWDFMHGADCRRTWSEVMYTDRNWIPNDPSVGKAGFTVNDKPKTSILVQVHDIMNTFDFNAEMYYFKNGDRYRTVFSKGLDAETYPERRYGCNQPFAFGGAAAEWEESDISMDSMKLEIKGIFSEFNEEEYMKEHRIQKDVQ